MTLKKTQQKEVTKSTTGMMLTKAMTYDRDAMMMIILMVLIRKKRTRITAVLHLSDAATGTAKLHNGIYRTCLRKRWSEREYC